MSSRPRDGSPSKSSHLGGGVTLRGRGGLGGRVRDLRVYWREVCPPAG